MQHSAEDKPCTETFFKHCWGVFCFQNGFGYCMSKAFGKMLLHLWRRGFLKSVKGQWWVFIWEKGQELALTMIVTANRPPRGRELHKTQEIKLPSWLQLKCEVKECILKIAWPERNPTKSVHLYYSKQNGPSYKCKPPYLTSEEPRLAQIGIKEYEPIEYRSK